MNLCRNLQLQRTLLGLASRCAVARAAGAVDLTAGCETSAALHLAAATVADLPRPQQWHRNVSRSFAAQAAEEESDSTELTLTDAAVEVRREALLFSWPLPQHNHFGASPSHIRFSGRLHRQSLAPCHGTAALPKYREAISLPFITAMTQLSHPLAI